MSQSELARRAAVPQTTINSLVHAGRRSTPHLLKIARELGTTPAYLAGETDDPAADAPPPPPAPRHQHVSLAVALPSERALTESFAALLSASRDMTERELARELARRLPMILGSASLGVLSSATDADDDEDEPEADHASAPQPARRAAGT